MKKILIFILLSISLSAYSQNYRIIKTTAGLYHPKPQFTSYDSFQSVDYKMTVTNSAISISGFYAAYYVLKERYYHNVDGDMITDDWMATDINHNSCGLRLIRTSYGAFLEIYYPGSYVTRLFKCIKWPLEKRYK
jgi:hypothetical protein